jgi:hypothetical protein
MSSAKTHSWSPYRPAVRFEAEPVPEPSTIALIVMAMLSLLGMARIRSRSAP